jgi:hypothetical protein
MSLSYPDHLPTRLLFRATVWAIAWSRLERLRRIKQQVRQECGTDEARSVVSATGRAQPPSQYLSYGIKADK